MLKGLQFLYQYLSRSYVAGICKLQSSTVSLHQYDKSPLMVAGECHANITINQHVLQATFVVVDVQNQLPLFGRNWIALLQFDVSTLMNQATQIHQTSENPLAAGILVEFSDVFKTNWVYSKELKLN